MDAVTCITTRRSIRKFMDRPVEKALLREVIDTARWSPSYKNSQPWRVIVLSGERKKALSEMLVGLLESGAPPSPDLPEPTAWPAAEEARISRLYRRRMEETGIDLGSPDVIRQAKKANFRFYGAPLALYLVQDGSLTPWSIFDMGLFAQSLMLSAHARGLGTVPQAFATDYAAQVKEFLGLPAATRIILGISLGYPDLEAPANRLRTERDEVDRLVSWAE